MTSCGEPFTTPASTSTLATKDPANRLMSTLTDTALLVPLEDPALTQDAAVVTFHWRRPPPGWQC
jgi:hypothetical protein